MHSQIHKKVREIPRFKKKKKGKKKKTEKRLTFPGLFINLRIQGVWR